MTEEKKRVSEVTGAIIGDEVPIGTLTYRFDSLNQLAVIYVKVDHGLWAPISSLSEGEKQMLRDNGVDPSMLEQMTVRVPKSIK